MYATSLCPVSAKDDSYRYIISNLSHGLAATAATRIPELSGPIIATGIPDSNSSRGVGLLQINEASGTNSHPLISHRNPLRAKQVLQKFMKM
jgi:hypothetical protein